MKQRIDINVLLFTIVLFLCSIALSTGAQAQGTVIRVHLLTADSAKVGATGKLLMLNGQKPRALKSGTIISIKDGKLLIDGAPCECDSFFLKPEGDKDLVYINERAYRGTIEIRKKTPANFFIINHVDIEDYLAGVLGGEVSASWPSDSLKAQAVAARTYILFKKKEPRDKNFDVYSTVMDQMYVGQGAETPRLLQMVRETRGQVITYHGDVIKAYYYSSCGGHTEDGAEVFPQDASFLKGVVCPYCKDSPGYNWSQDFTTDEVVKAVEKGGTPPGPLTDLRIARVDNSGRAAEIVLAYDGIDKTIRGSDLRMALGPGRLKSTKFTMTMDVKKREPIPAEIITAWSSRLSCLQFLDETLCREAIPFAQASPYTASFKSDMEPLNLEIRESIIPIKTEVAVLTGRLQGAQESISATLHFSGQGWGHGVGMCQWGAYTMATRGSSYDKILQFYYPGTTLMKINQGG
jgi:stage II sporulation protein D